MRWRELISVGQLDQLILHSHRQAVAIFKHSTRCGTSALVKNRVERDWHYSDEQLPIYYLDLLRHRDISDTIVERTGIEHQSPQLIILKDGKAVYDRSHMAISVGGNFLPFLP